MKKLILTLFIIILLFPKQTKAQNNTGVAVAAVTAAGVLGGILSIENIKESLELNATQWVLANHPEFKSFNLEAIDLNDKKAKDMSSTSLISFKIQEFTPNKKPVLDGKKWVLFCFTSYGWVSEQGLNYSKVSWYLIDSNEWINMMVAFVKVASEEKDDKIIREALMTYELDKEGLGKKASFEEKKVSFYKLNGDSYLVTDYSQEMKFIYNEKSFCIFFKKTGNLVQMNLQTVIETQKFLLFE